MYKLFESYTLLLALFNEIQKKKKKHLKKTSMVEILILFLSLSNRKP